MTTRHFWLALLAAVSLLTGVASVGAKPGRHSSGAGLQIHHRFRCAEDLPQVRDPRRLLPLSGALRVRHLDPRRDARRARVSEGRDSQRRVLRRAGDLPRQVRDRDPVSPELRCELGGARAPAPGLRRPRALLRAAVVGRGSRLACRKSAPPRRRRVHPGRDYGRPTAGRGSVRDERAVRQAERAHGRLANRAELLPLPRQIHVHRGRQGRARPQRRCRKARRTTTTTSATSRCSTTTSKQRYRSPARARMRSTSVVTGGFQGCKDDSICYPPGEQTMSLVLPATSDFPASAAASSSSGGPVSEQDQYVDRIVNGSWWTMIGVFFVAGLALSLTPCVLPMVPILSSIIAGQGGTVSTSRGFFLSLELRARHGGHLHRRGRARRARGRPDPGDVPETLDRHVVRLGCSSCSRSECSAYSSCRCRRRSRRGCRSSPTSRRAARSSASESWARSRR